MDTSMIESHSVMNNISIDFNIITVLMLLWIGSEMCNIYTGQCCASFQEQVASATTLAITSFICIRLMYWSKK